MAWVILFAVLAIGTGSVDARPGPCYDGNVGAVCTLSKGFDGVCSTWTVQTPGGPEAAYACWMPVHGGAASDPIITGFDGKPFHFDQTGEFTLLSSGDGLRVDVTFAGASTQAQEETSWTSSVRFIAPNGDMVACALPAIQRNTSRVQVLSEQGNVAGCQVATSKLQATIYQVSGYEQAVVHPEEAWAAPYTWLNTDITLRKPLPAPVTGILGKSLVRLYIRLLSCAQRTQEGGVEAGVAGEPGSRRLAGVAGPVFLESFIAGIATR
ncbi:hypothetical protein N2152v2_008154 [Parachlorella kessleri]